MVRLVCACLLVAGCGSPTAIGDGPPPVDASVPDASATVDAAVPADATTLPDLTLPPLFCDGNAAGVTFAACGDLVEGNGLAGPWSFSGPDAMDTVLSSIADAYRGASALRAVTAAGLPYTLRYTHPGGTLAATATDDLRVALRALDTNMPTWQLNVPLVTLEDAAGARRVLTPSRPLVPTDGRTWVYLAVPLAGGGDFASDGAAIDLGHLRAVELQFDTWGYGLTIDVDALSVERHGAMCAPACPPSCNGRGYCTFLSHGAIDGCACMNGASGPACSGCADGFTLVGGACVPPHDGAFDTWPNPASAANSDPWLVAHHDDIRVVRPRVLVVNFANPSDPAKMDKLVADVIAGFREGSRFHGYDDPTAPAQLEYQVARLVDLRDGVGGRPAPQPGYPYQNSTLYPRRAQGDPGYWGCDYKQFFTPSFASLYGFPDPACPGEFLDLCALAEQGVIHEVWMIGSGDVPDSSAAEVLETKPRYDGDGNRVAGDFDACAGNGCFDADVPHCDVSLRIGFINYNRGPGCYLHSELHGVESTGASGDIPPMREWFLPLWAHGACGTVHTPPNGATDYDYDNSKPAPSTCKGYGQYVACGTPVPPAMVSRDDWARYGAITNDCGGEFLIWWMQNFPGHRTAGAGGQYLPDGRPMRSLWPYRFY